MNSATSTMVVAPPSALAARCGPDQPRSVVGRTGLGVHRGRAVDRRTMAVDRRTMVVAGGLRTGRRRSTATGAVEHGGTPGQVRRDALGLERHRRPTSPLVLEL